VRGRGRTVADADGEPADEALRGALCGVH